ncbi:MAG: hypothetical protein PHE84_07875 [bacterium]|nr:hypothetical protein [bacterium]
MEEKVKGTIFVDFVKTIRSSKDERILSYLTEKDREVISGLIFPSGWYQLDTFLRCLTAVFEVLGDKKPENARMWGRVFGAKIFTGVYKDIKFTGDKDVPVALKGFALTSKTFFTGSGLEQVFAEGKKARFRVTRVTELPAITIFFHVLAGCLEVYIEMAGGQNPQVSFTEKVIDGKKEVVFETLWD